MTAAWLTSPPTVALLAPIAAPPNTATCTCGLMALSASLCSICRRTASTVRPAALTDPANGTLIVPSRSTVIGRKGVAPIEPPVDGAPEAAPGALNKPGDCSMTEICKLSPTAILQIGGRGLPAESSREAFRANGGKRRNDGVVDVENKDLIERSGPGVFDLQSRRRLGGHQRAARRESQDSHCGRQHERAAQVIEPRMRPASAGTPQRSYG